MLASEFVTRLNGFGPTLPLLVCKKSVRFRNRPTRHNSTPCSPKSLLTALWPPKSGPVLRTHDSTRWIRHNDPLAWPQRRGCQVPPLLGINPFVHGQSLGLAYRLPQLLKPHLSKIRACHISAQTHPP